MSTRDPATPAAPGDRSTQACAEPRLDDPIHRLGTVALADLTPARRRLSVGTPPAYERGADGLRDAAR